MAGVELILGSLTDLCFNISCLQYDFYNAQTTSKQRRVVDLANQIMNEHLIITTLENGDLSGIRRENGSIVGTGVAFDLLNILQLKYKFNYTLVTPEQNIFGTGNKGVFDLLEKDEAHVAAAFLPVINLYRDKIKYSPSLDTGEWVVMMKRPKESASGAGLLAPFTAPVWGLIILSLLVVGPIIYLLIVVQSRLCNDDRNKVFTLPACMWFVYGALLKQGSTLNPVTDSSRLLFSTWWIFITILTAFYTANLTAFLTLSKFTLPISKPKDIGDNKNSWITNRGNGIEDALFEEDRNMEIDSKSRLKRIIGTPRSLPDESDQVILEKFVKKMDWMFIREKPIVDYIMYKDYKQKVQAQIDEEDRCTFVITKFSVTTIPRAFAYSNNFKYKELFDSTIQYLVESGIIKFKLREPLPDTEICPLNLGNTERRLKNADLTMTYMIVGGGLLISLVVFLIELIIEFINSRQKEARRPKTRNLNILGINNNFDPSLSKKFTPPPPYNTLFNYNVLNREYKKKMVNGREYWITHSDFGEGLIPVRSPSALLFQFSH